MYSKFSRKYNSYQMHSLSPPDEQFTNSFNDSSKKYMENISMLDSNMNSHHQPLLSSHPPLNPQLESNSLLNNNLINNSSLSNETFGTISLANHSYRLSNFNNQNPLISNFHQVNQANSTNSSNLLTTSSNIQLNNIQQSNTAVTSISNVIDNPNQIISTPSLNNNSNENNENLNVIIQVMSNSGDNTQDINSSSLAIRSFLIILNIFICLISITILFFNYLPSWDKKCDFKAKVFTIGYLTLAIMDSIKSLFFSRLYNHYYKLFFLLFNFFLQIFILYLGFSVIVFKNNCGEQTVALLVSYICFFLFCITYILPIVSIVIIIIVLLCLIPFSRSNISTNPTPTHVLNTIEVIKFRDLIPDLSQESINDYTSNSQSYKCCAICMTELEDDDEVRVMPCDRRHFFHSKCVEYWLEKSRYCPICRANIVDILSNKNTENSNSIDSTTFTSNNIELPEIPNINLN